MRSICLRPSRLLLFLLWALGPSWGQAQLFWQTQDLINDRMGSGQYVDLYADGVGGLHLTYWHHTEDQLYYGHRPSGAGDFSWQAIDQAANNGYRAAVVADAQAQPHIAYFENVGGQMRLRYAFRDSSGAWTVVRPSELNFGNYGPQFMLAQGNIQASITLTLLPDGRPYIVFFDGTFDQVTRTYGCRMWRAFQVQLGSTVWIVEDFGFIPAFNPAAPAVTCCEGIRGARYGEYSRIVRQPNGLLRIVTPVKVNGEIHIRDQALAGNYRDFLPPFVVDSNRRITGRPATDDNARANATFEGLGATVTPDSILHLSYGLTGQYGTISAGTQFPNTPSLHYARVYPNDSIAYRRIAPLPSGTDSRNRGWTDLVHWGNDTLLMVYTEQSANGYRLALSYDGGNTWQLSSLYATNTPWNPARLAIIGDSVHVAFYDNDRQQLMTGSAHRNTLLAPWQFVARTFSTQHGNLISAAYPSATGPIHWAYANPVAQQLHYGSWQNGTFVDQVVAEQVQPVAIHLDVTRAGNVCIAYGDSRSDSTRILIGDGSGSWNTLVLAANYGSAHIAARISPTDSIWAAWHDPLVRRLRLARGPLAGPLTISDLDFNPFETNGQFPAMLLNPQGLPVVAYRSTNNTGIRIAKYDGSTWQIDTLIISDSLRPGQWLQLAQAQDGTLHLAWRQALGNVIGYARQAPGSTWYLQDSIVLPYETLGQVGNPLRLALDTTGQPLLLLNSGTTTNSIFLYRLSAGGQWQPMPLVNPRQVAASFAFQQQNNAFFIVGRKQSPLSPGLALLSSSPLFIAPDAVRESEPLAGIWRIYPNPTRETLWLQMPAELAGGLQLELIDLKGRSWPLQTPNLEPADGQPLQVSLAGVPSGMYVLRAYSQQGSWSTKVMVMP